MDSTTTVHSIGIPVKVSYSEKEKYDLNDLKVLAHPDALVSTGQYTDCVSNKTIDQTRKQAEHVLRNSISLKHMDIHANAILLH